MNRSTESSGSFTGMIAPPPANPTRSSFPKKPASSGVQGADLFSIGQTSSSARASPVPAPQEDFFGLNDPTPTKPQQTQSPKPASNTATQDLFSMNAPSSTSAAPAAATNQATAAKASNTDWKNSIMSL